jgi:hypothetical protein
VAAGANANCEAAGPILPRAAAAMAAAAAAAAAAVAAAEIRVHILIIMAAMAINLSLRQARQSRLLTSAVGHRGAWRRCGRWVLPRRTPCRRQPAASRSAWFGRAVAGSGTHTDWVWEAAHADERDGSAEPALAWRCGGRQPRPDQRPRTSSPVARCGARPCYADLSKLLG